MKPNHLLIITALLLLVPQVAPKPDKLKAAHLVRCELLREQLRDGAARLDAGEFQTLDELHAWIKARSEAASNAAFYEMASAVNESAADGFEPGRTADVLRGWAGE